MLEITSDFGNAAKFFLPFSFSFFFLFPKFSTKDIEIDWICDLFFISTLHLDRFQNLRGK